VESHPMKNIAIGALVALIGWLILVAVLLA
jgi:hypothetical protein